MCDGNPMCEYQNMVAIGWKETPFIIWPQDAINLIIDGLKHRKNENITISLREGHMKIERKDI